MVGAGHLGRKKPRERRLGWGGGWGLWSRWHGLGGNGVAEKHTNQTEKWVRNCDYVCQRGGVQGRKGRFPAKAWRTGGMGGKAAGRQGEENRSFGK